MARGRIHATRKIFSLACQGAPENFQLTCASLHQTLSSQFKRRAESEWNKAGRTNRSITESACKREAGMEL
jgi:hypothetical protein